MTKTKVFHGFLDLNRNQLTYGDCVKVTEHIGYGSHKIRTGKLIDISNRYVTIETGAEGVTEIIQLTMNTDKAGNWVAYYNVPYSPDRMEDSILILTSASEFPEE